MIQLDFHIDLYFVYLPDKERYSPKSFKNEQYLNKAKIIKLVKTC